MSGESVGDGARPFETMAAEEHRVALRCRPYATFAQPRQGEASDRDQAGRMVAQAAAWDAARPRARLGWLSRIGTHRHVAAPANARP